MKFKHILAALALSVPGLMSAVSADPRIRTATNPDGTVVSYRVHGNEFFHFMTDAECTRILHRDSRGFITDAVRDGRALTFSRENVAMLAEEAQVAFPQAANFNSSSMKRMATLDMEGRSNYPTIGKGNRSLVVLVEFQDVEFTVENPKDYFTRQLNEPGFSDYGACGSALDYYKAASNGLYQPQFDVYGPVKVSKNASDYEAGANSMSLFIREALTELHDSGEIDFSNYDFDEDGVVDTVFFYYAGYGSADSGTRTIWPHQSDYRYYPSLSPLRFDGRKVGPYACANELKGENPTTGKSPWNDGSEPWVDGIGTFVHEYGHVLGLPDLYDINYTPGVAVVTPGDCDVMASGSYNGNGCVPPLYSAYEQWVCRWLEYTEAVDATSYSLPALGSSETPVAVRIGIPTTADREDIQPEYFVVEARDKSGWDAKLPDSGLFVWRINYDRNSWVDNLVNSKDGSNVEIIYSDGKKNPVFTQGAIYEGSKVELIPSKEYDYWKSPIITKINYDNDSATGSFDYNVAKRSDIFTVLHDAPVAASDGSRSFRLSWDPVEDADSYLLTVRVKNSGRVIVNYDGKDMGKETSVWVSGMSSIQWKLELEAFVICMKDGLPSTESSNVVTFKPSELSLEGEDNAVEGVEDAAWTVSGGVGCIHAPEGAVVCDLTGKRLAMDGLAPGVYVVSFAGNSRKVLVR